MSLSTHFYIVKTLLEPEKGYLEVDDLTAVYERSGESKEELICVFTGPYNQQVNHQARSICAMLKSKC